MSLGKLCFFTLLAIVVASPAIRKLELDVRQSDARPTNSANGEMPVFVPVQSKDPKDVGTGKLLVASRELADSNFAKTVILLVHCDTEGAVGLMLNRRTHIPISRLFAHLQSAKDLSDPVYLGGPVETPTVFALRESRDKLEDAERVFDRVYWISGKTGLEKTISSRPEAGAFHLYLGYAGWTTDQLRTEVRLGAWLILPADTQSIFTADPDSLWRDLIKKTELNVAEGPMTTRPELPASAEQHISETE